MLLRGMTSSSSRGSSRPWTTARSKITSGESGGSRPPTQQHLLLPMKKPRLSLWTWPLTLQAGCRLLRWGTPALSLPWRPDVPPKVPAPRRSAGVFTVTGEGHIRDRCPTRLRDCLRQQARMGNRQTSPCKRQSLTRPALLISTWCKTSEVRGGCQHLAHRCWELREAANRSTQRGCGTVRGRRWPTGRCRSGHLWARPRWPRYTTNFTTFLRTSRIFSRDSRWKGPSLLSLLTPDPFAWNKDTRLRPASANLSETLYWYLSFHCSHGF